MAYTFKHGDRPLDRLTIQRAVGRGGFGEVYYAVYDSGKQVAAKYLRENPEVELRGISQVMNLKSPHLITIYDVLHNTENEPFVIMEYVSGPSLRELLTAEPEGMGPQKAAFFLQGIASGLSYLHERGIVHRDLKPGNIFYDDGYVKIGDYGLSKHIAMSAHSGNTVSVGTVHYMAPEIGSGSYSKAIDIYAMGVILYELLTGRLPYTGSSMGEILMRHLNDRPDLVGIPEPFRSVIAKALAKDPKERYQDVNEMVDDITSVQEISESIATFNPASLASAPRFPEASDAQTQTSPGARKPAVPTLDARDGGFPPIPPIPPVPGEGKGKAPNVAAAPRRSRSRWPQMFMVLMIAIAAGLLIGVTTDTSMPEAGIALVMMLVGGTIGTLFAHMKLVDFLPIRNGFMERVVYVSTAAVFMLPGIVIANEGVRDNDFGPIFIPLLALIGLFNWNERIESARRGRVDGSRAVWPAFFCMIIGAAVTEGDFPLQTAALGGTLAMLLPTAAAIFRYHEEPAPVRMQRAAAAYDRVVTPPPVAERRPVVPPPVPSPRPPAPTAQAPETPKPTAPAPAPAVDQPSFVGRAANASLAFFAKALIVIGFVWALGYHMRFELPGGERAPSGYISLSSVQIIEHGRKVAHFSIPRFVVFIPFVIGLFALMTARRGDSGCHFMRGIIGCALAMFAAGVALGPASDALMMIFRDELDGLRDSDQEALIGLVMLIISAISFLFWPKRKARQTMVI